MLTKLAMNRHKPIWTTATEDNLLALVYQELHELSLALHTGHKNNILLECADAANYLAMIVDIALRRVPTDG